MIMILSSVRTKIQVVNTVHFELIAETDHEMITLKHTVNALRTVYVTAH